MHIANKKYGFEARKRFLVMPILVTIYYYQFNEPTAHPEILQSASPVQRPAYHA
jgi:hypothetical protein